MKLLVLIFIGAPIFALSRLDHFKNHHLGRVRMRPKFRRVAQTEMDQRRLGPSFGACMKSTGIMLSKKPAIFFDQMLSQHSDGLKKHCELMLKITAGVQHDMFSAFF